MVGQIIYCDEEFVQLQHRKQGKRKGTALLCTRVNKTRTFSGFVFVHLIVQKTLKVYVMRSTKGNACKKTCRLEHLKNKLDKALTKSYAVKCYAGTPQMT